MSDKPEETPETVRNPSEDSDQPTTMDVVHLHILCGDKRYLVGPYLYNPHDGAIAHKVLYSVAHETDVVQTQLCILKKDYKLHPFYNKKTELINNAFEKALSFETFDEENGPVADILRDLKGDDCREMWVVTLFDERLRDGTVSRFKTFLDSEAAENFLPEWIDGDKGLVRKSRTFGFIKTIRGVNYYAAETVEGKHAEVGAIKYVDAKADSRGRHCEDTADTG